VGGAVCLTRKSEDLSTTSAKSLHRDPLLEDSRWGVCWRMGFSMCCFPPVVFPPCCVWLGLCVGRVDPALAFTRWQLGMISPRASARQTRAGRRLAAGRRGCATVALSSTTPADTTAGTTASRQYLGFRFSIQWSLGAFSGPCGFSGPWGSGSVFSGPWVRSVVLVGSVVLGFSAP